MMNLPPLPKLPKATAHIHSDDAVCWELPKPIDWWPIDVHSETALRTYAEQYGRLCAEAEREACAKACEDDLPTDDGVLAPWNLEGQMLRMFRSIAATAKQACAAAIRARSK